MMDRDMTVTEGMPVYGMDNQQIGMVERLHGDGFHVNGQHYSNDQIERIEDGAVYLRGGAMAATEGQAGARDIGAVQDDEIRVPVAEERLAVGTREVDLGEVEIRKTVETEEQTVPVTLRRDEVIVNEVRVDERPATGEDLFEEGTIRVPVRGEEAVVAKETVVTGEVVVEKDTTAEEQQITDTIRRQRVEVDKNYQEARGGFEQAHATRQSAASDDWGRNRTFEQAEPNYRSGYYAANDERYTGREFDEAEPELRRDYEMNVTTQTYKTVGQGNDTEIGEQPRVGGTAGGGMAGTGGAAMPADYAGDSDAVIGGGTQAPANADMSGDRVQTAATTSTTGSAANSGTMENAGDTWEQLREEIREGWNRGRNR